MILNDLHRSELSRLAQQIAATSGVRSALPSTMPAPPPPVNPAEELQEGERGMAPSPAIAPAALASIMAAHPMFAQMRAMKGRVPC